MKIAFSPCVSLCNVECINALHHASIEIECCNLPSTTRDSLSGHIHCALAQHPVKELSELLLPSARIPPAISTLVIVFSIILYSL